MKAPGRPLTPTQRELLRHYAKVWRKRRKQFRQLQAGQWTRFIEQVVRSRRDWIEIDFHRKVSSADCQRFRSVLSNCRATMYFRWSVRPSLIDENSFMVRVLGMWDSLI